MVDVKFSSLVYELKGEMRGLWGVVIAGAIGPSILLLPNPLLGPILPIFLYPLPLMLASHAKREEKEIGSAVMLGATLGYIMMALTQVLIRSPVICKPVGPTGGILNAIMFPYLILALAPPLLPLTMLWIFLAAFPAYVVHKNGVSSRLVLLMTSAALAIGSILSLICSLRLPARMFLILRSSFMFSSFLDAVLFIYLLYYALGGRKGKRFLTSFVTFSLLVRSMSLGAQIR